MTLTTVKPKMAKDLILLKDLSKEEISNILDRGDYWADSLNSRFTNIPRSIDNPVVCNLFFETSTRTRFSFEVAAKKLGFHVLNFDPKTSSTEKGETLYDTLRTLEAMKVSVAIIRSPEEGILQEIASKLDMSVINAGAGANEHPSQGLLDLLTMRQHFGRIEGLKVAIIGDIKHSRVANSNIIGLSKFGAQIMLAGPKEWMPETYSSLFYEPDEAVSKADIVMLLRVQKERHTLKQNFEIREDGTFIIREGGVESSYFERYGLSQNRFERMQAHAVIMHPAPFNRCIEIDGDLVENPRSLIYKQVSNGVAVRMAVLERAL